MDEKRNEIILFENQGVKLEVNLKDLLLMSILKMYIKKVN